MSDKIQDIIERLKKLLSLWIDLAQIDQLEIESKVDEKGVLIEINGPKEVLSLIIGKSGQTVNAIRTILKSMGGAMGAAISLKVQTRGLEDKQ